LSPEGSTIPIPVPPTLPLNDPTTWSEPGVTMDATSGWPISIMTVHGRSVVTDSVAPRASVGLIVCGTGSDPARVHGAVDSQACDRHRHQARRRPPAVAP